MACVYNKLLIIIGVYEFTDSRYGLVYQFRSDLLECLYLRFKGVPVNRGVINLPLFI